MDTFYVMYSPSTGQYLNFGDQLVPFDQAERFARSRGIYAEQSLAISRQTHPDACWVGPCEEGEAP